MKLWSNMDVEIENNARPAVNEPELITSPNNGLKYGMDDESEFVDLETDRQREGEGRRRQLAAAVRAAVGGAAVARRPRARVVAGALSLSLSRVLRCDRCHIVYL